jgi:hypothetical protein
MEQPTLEFEKTPTIGTLNALVLTIMSDGNWYMPWELCAEVKRRTGVLISDSSSSARLRDLRKAKYGGHIVEKRRRQESTAYEYRLTQ